MTLIRNTRQEQVDRDSQEFADLEYVIDSFTDIAASIQEEMKALQAWPPEMMSERLQSY
ncbi:MAG: hypothetical protein OXC19_05625 [Bryobacterales bacterium]|nr:hypothetical protein [Bryobacterales bacterium]